MKKVLISVGVSILIIAVAIGATQLMNNFKKEEIEKEERKATLVEVEQPQQGDVTFSADATGKLVAVERFDIVSEVSGQLQKQALIFKEGKYYKKGELMLAINSREYEMGLIASKSNFITTITSVLADLKYDYPDSYDTWYNYVNRIDVKETLPNIPKAASDKEKFFLVSRGLYSQYYNIEAQQERLSKYIIRAPYNGVVTYANAVEGEAVNPGSRLGSFINTNAFDLEVTYPLHLINSIKIGTQANLTSVDTQDKWTGKVVRIGGSIDSKTQSVKVFIRVRGRGLLEGMYLTASVKMQPIKDAITLSRKLIDSDNNVFVVEDNRLKLKKVNIIESQGDRAVVKGLSPSDKVMTTIIKSAYNGMPVRLK